MRHDVVSVGTINISCKHNIVLRNNNIIMYVAESQYFTTIQNI